VAPVALHILNILFINYECCIDIATDAQCSVKLGEHQQHSSADTGWLCSYCN